jgi:hypothetical protein
MEGNEPTEKGRNTVFSVSCSPRSDPLVMIPSSITKLAISKPNWRSLLPANFFLFRHLLLQILRTRHHPLVPISLSRSQIVPLPIYQLQQVGIVRISTENTALPSALARETKARDTPMNTKTPT